MMEKEIVDQINHARLHKKVCSPVELVGTTGNVTLIHLIRKTEKPIQMEV